MNLKQLLSVGVVVAILPGSQGNAWITKIAALKSDMEKSKDFVGYGGTVTVSGHITMNDFLQWAKNENPGVLEDRKVSKVAQAAFVKADTNHDFKLNPAEWKTLVGILSPSKQSGLKSWIQADPTPTKFKTTFTANSKVTIQDYSDEVDGLVPFDIDAQVTALLAFTKADANDDKELDREEFKTLLDNEGVGNAKDAFKDWALTLGTMSVPGEELPEKASGVSFDENKDNKLSRNEFAAWYARKVAATKFDPKKVLLAREVFESADVNLDGYLTGSELTNLIRKEKAKNDDVDPPANFIKHIVNPQGTLGGAGDKTTFTTLLHWATTHNIDSDGLPQLLHAFNKADVDEDGALDSDEMTIMMGTFQSADPVASRSTSSSSCFTNNVDYMGHDAVAGRIGLGSAIACQQRCGAFNAAKFFQFQPVSNSRPSVCWCKTSDAGSVSHEDRTVGPLQCESPVGLWETHVVDKPMSSVAIVGTVMGIGALAMSLVLWLASKRFSDRSLQTLPEALPLEVQE